MNREEDVLLVTDDDYIADVITRQCIELGACPSIFRISERQRPIRRLSSVLESAVASANVILTPFQDIPEESTFRYQIVATAVKNVAGRLGHMPGVDRDMFEKCISKTDYAEIERLGIKLVQALARAKSCQLTSDSGTDLKLDLGGWQNKADAQLGDIKYYGSWENLPSGETFKVPVEGTCEGRLVVDGAVPGKAFDQEKDERITFEVRMGKIVKIEDNTGLEFEKKLAWIDEADPDFGGNIYKIAELGIGTNHAARISPRAIEFEKRLGTVHLAIGENRFYGGTISAPQHIDMMVLSPSLTINGIELMVDGRLLESAIEELADEDFSNYKPYSKIRLKPKTKIYPSREIGVCESKAEALYRTWKSPGGRIFRTHIGNERTARMMSKASDIIRHKSLDIESLAESLGISYSNCEMLVKMMLDFQIIELSQ